MTNRDGVVHENIAWWYYGEHTPENVGKFMTFVQGAVPSDLRILIVKAIEEGVTTHVKHTNPEHLGANPHGNGDSSVIIWYSSDEREALKGLAVFLIEHGLVRKTKAGRYYNISFKYDEQTRDGNYGGEFKAAIKLADLMDLDTGVFY